ncbi:unannotated protein [freshwater metagenome]|jgi:hypothetical protein|uniref:Unannotated protein n=1 Tax=freshwater metagenome TaxID=449393 RepID=A0A6J6FMV1_9ZZZZ
MKMLRRAIAAITLTGIAAAILRIRGKGGVPPERGGWRELTRPPS